MKSYEDKSGLADHFDKKFRDKGLDVPRAVSVEIEKVVREVTEREFERVLREAGSSSGSRLPKSQP